MLPGECEQVNLMVECKFFFKIINKYFQFLWTGSPDHENIVDKSKPQVWLMGEVKESVAFKFTKKQISVGRSHRRAHSRAVFLKVVFGIKCEVIHGEDYSNEVANGFRRWASVGKPTVSIRV